MQHKTKKRIQKKNVWWWELLRLNAQARLWGLLYIKIQTIDEKVYSGN